MYDVYGHNVSSTNITNIDLLPYDLAVHDFLKKIVDNLEALSLELSDSAIERMEASMIIRDLIHNRFLKHLKVEVS